MPLAVGARKQVIKLIKLIHRETKRGELPVLHVVGSNTVARGLYERMGFRDLRETLVRVVVRG